MAAMPSPVFHGFVYASMLVVNDEIAALADRVALELPRIVERVRVIDGYTFTFTREQHTTLIAALALAGQQYAHPEIVADTLAVISEPAAETLRSWIQERAERIAA